MAVKQRKTGTIKYNLFDRGYKHNGQNRNDIDHLAVVRMINSNQVQELVRTGMMIGFYGHQIRQRFGMRPPEVTYIDGKTVFLEPAFKTIHLKAYDNGDVEHIAEFLPNDAGEHALNQYKANVGGFSTAIDYIPSAKGRTPTGFFGFDYVMQTNYVTNVGDGVLYDGLFVPQSGIDHGAYSCFDSLNDDEKNTVQAQELARTLETSILHTMQYIEDSVKLQRQITLRDQEQKRADAKAQYKKECASSLRGEVVHGFDAIWSDAQRKAELVPTDLDFNKKKEPPKDPKKGSFSNRFKIGV